MGGGQDARDVALTDEGAGGFEIRLQSIIFTETLSQIHGHFGPVHSVDFSPDGFAFASGGEDGYVHYHRFPPEYFTNDFEWSEIMFSFCAHSIDFNEQTLLF